MWFAKYTAKETRLPNPQISGSLAQTVNNRTSCKEFNGKRFTETEVSNILWFAFGRNKKGTRTIPTAMNEQNLKVFVLGKEGIWQYEGMAHTLIKISEENALPCVEMQEYVKDGALHLIYTGSDKDYSCLHAGSAYQNVYLYAAENGLGTVVRAFIDKEKLKSCLKLSSNEFVIIHQVVGYKLEKD